MFIDLHMHTCASDGTWTPEEVVSQIKDKNISIFAVTDHNTIESSRKIKENTKLEGLYFIPGVEISSLYNNTEYHITTYGIDFDNVELISLVNLNEKNWDDRNTDTIRKMSNIYPEINFEEFLKYDYERTRGGLKAFNYLIDVGLAKTPDDCTNLVIKYEEKAKYKAPSEVIKSVHSAGGYAFLAHPSAYNGRQLMPETALKKFIDFGIDGLECYTPYCDMKDSLKYVDFCKKNNLKISGGSDCHGTFLQRKLGNPQITFDMLDTKFWKNLSI